MSVWVRETTLGRLIRVRVKSTQAHSLSSPTFPFTPNMAEDQLPPPPGPRSLNQIFYPPRSTNPCLLYTSDAADE